MVGHKYSEEEHNFLRSFIPGHTYKEIIAEYNKRFEEPITQTRVKGYMSNHKINNGLTGRFKKGHVPYNKGKHCPSVGRMAETQFKKGGLPPNTKPVGYERITKDGYVEVKIKMRPNYNNDNFKLKHRLVWEEVHGKIPKGYKIIFLDGNKQNCSIENLAIVSAKEEIELMRRGLFSKEAELTKTGVLIAKAGVITQERKKRKRDRT